MQVIINVETKRSSSSSKSMKTEEGHFVDAERYHIFSRNFILQLVYGVNLGCVWVVNSQLLEQLCRELKLRSKCFIICRATR